MGALRHEDGMDRSNHRSYELEADTIACIQCKEDASHPSLAQRPRQRPRQTRANHMLSVPDQVQ